MSYGEGDLHARVGELERENARLRASLLSLTEGDRVDWPSIALDWDGASDRRKREWCQWLYEHAARQEGRIEALEQENERLQAQLGEVGQAHHRTLERGRALESLVHDMYESLWTVSEAWAYDLYRDRVAELGIDMEGGGA